VIEAEQVEQAMDDEVGNMISKGDAGVARFVADRLIGQHDVAERTRLGVISRGERKNVGRRILAAPRAVHVPHLSIVGEKDRDLVGSLRRGWSSQKGRPRCSLNNRVANRATPNFGMANHIDLKLQA